MKNTGKALLATTLLGTTTATVVLGLLYNSCLESHATYAPKLEEAKQQLKDLEEKLANSKAEVEAKEVELGKAKADLQKYENTSVDLAPCQFVESNFDYKQQYESAISQLQEVQGQLDDTKEELVNTKKTIKNSDDDLRKEVTTLTQNYQEQVKQTNEWKAKYASSQQQVSELKTQLEKEQQASVKNTQHQIGMMADMSKQYEDDKAKWEAKIADLQSQIKSTVDYWLGKTDGCDYHYSSSQNRYGKSCEAGIDGVDREMWFAGQVGSTTGDLLKDQFDKAPQSNKYVS